MSNLVFRGKRFGEDYQGGETLVEYRWGETSDTWKVLPLCLQYVDHSPTGFEWGYYGSGPSQLAFAILFMFSRKVLGYDIEMARNYSMYKYMYFKQDFVATWKKEWYLTEQEIITWMWDNNRDTG